jgi:hypothetical protein
MGKSVSFGGALLGVAGGGVPGAFGAPAGSLLLTVTVGEVLGA